MVITDVTIGPPAQRRSQADMEHALNTLRQRLAPQITDRGLMRTYLQAANWDVNRAYNRWQADRTRILAGNQGTPAQANPSSLDSDDESGSESSDASTCGEPGTSKPPDGC